MEWRRQMNQERVSMLLVDDFNQLKRSNSSFMNNELARIKAFKNRKGSHELSSPIDLPEEDVRRSTILNLRSSAGKQLTKSNLNVVGANQVRDENSDKYYKERFDLLIFEKKKWLEDKKGFREKISKLED